MHYEKNKPSNVASSAATIVERGIKPGASYSTQGERPYRAPGEKVATAAAVDPTLAAVRLFVGAVRGEHAVFADVHCGFRAAIACSVAHNAVYAESKMNIPKAKSGKA